VVRNEALFNERLFSAVAQDEKKLDSLRNLAFTHTGDLPALKKALQDIDNQRDVLGTGGVLSKTTEALYNCLTQSAPETWQFLLYQGGITSRWSYYWYGKEGRSKAAAALVGGALLVALILGCLRVWTPENRGRYCIWRIEKTNSTDSDRFRSGQHLQQCLQETQNSYAPLAELLRHPGLPVKTAESVLGFLVESRDFAASQQVNLPALLAESLRTDNPDVRRRTNDTLLYVAAERKVDVGDLANWKPSAEDSVADIDKRVKQWKALKWPGP
jgi:hypothetical protein